MIGLMFILGIFIGGFIGIFIMSCLQISKYADSDSSNMFWIPVSDSKLETQDFPNLNFTSSDFNENNNFNFPNMNN